MADLSSSDDPSPLSEGADRGAYPDNVLLWTPDQQLLGFRNYRTIFPTRTIPAGNQPLPLPERPRKLSQVRYEVDGDTFDLQGFREHNRVVGLLVMKDGAIVLEEYGLGNTRVTEWASFSIAKSVVSLLMGAAIRDGYISSVDDLVADYLPLLKGSAYERVTIRSALQMSSGAKWNEDYADPESDVSNEVGRTALERLQYLGDQPRVAAPGEHFNYSTGEGHLVGELVRAAIGDDLSTYLATKIWQPFGMEADANWVLVEPGGAEHGGAGISATLRDCGRIGLFALSGGVLPDSRQVLPDSWMEESTTPSPANDEYGYLWWLQEGGAYNARGIFGQAISVDPVEGLVIVTQSAWPRATGPEFSAHRDALFAALTVVLHD